MLKYLLAAFIVSAVAPNACAQLNLLKGNWEDYPATNRIWIADTISPTNTVNLNHTCDEEFNLQVNNDTLLFTLGQRPGHRREIGFKILQLNDSVLNVKVVRNIEFTSRDSFPGKTELVMHMMKTGRKLEGPMSFEKLRYAHGPVMVVGEENQLQIDSTGLIRCKVYKTETGTGRDKKTHDYNKPEYKEGKFSKTDLANFLQLIDSVQLPSLHIPDYCVMDGEWAELIFNYNGVERVTNFHLWDFNKAPDVQKLLNFLYSLPNAAYMKPAKKKMDISFHKQSKVRQ